MREHDLDIFNGDYMTQSQNGLRDIGFAYPTRFELTIEQNKRLQEWLIDVTQLAAKIQGKQENVNRPLMLERMLKISASRPLSEKEEGMLSRLKKPLPRPLPYYGEEGGGISFTFVPTKRGTFCRVTESITGNFIDLDDLGWG